MELSTEEVQEYLSNSSGRIVIRLPLFSGQNVAIDRSIGFVSSLEESGVDAEVIVFSKNALSHEKVVPNGRRSTKTKMCEWIIDSLHLDYLPYTDVIISVDENKENLELVRKLCMRYGILDINDILVRQ